MATATPNDDDCVTNCPAEQDADKCAKLRREIDELINRNKHDPSVPNAGKGRHGLVHRFREMVSNMARLGDSPSADLLASAQHHIDEIKNAQKQLTEKLDQLEDQDCGDPPPGAWTWAQRPIQQFQDQVNAASRRVSALDAAKTGALVGGGVTAGYVLYRVVRMIPSLLPPLWETIPVNLAVP